jgi:hypothetical protein
MEIKECLGRGQGTWCANCGADISDMSVQCYDKEVLALRTQVTGRTYPFGLDTGPAFALCKGEFFRSRTS